MSKKFTLPGLRLPRWRFPKIHVSIPPTFTRFFIGTLIIVLAGWIALPNTFSISTPKLLQPVLPFLDQETIKRIPEKMTFAKVPFDLNRFGIPLSNTLELRQGLDIQGGTQVTLEADMSSVPQEQKLTALESTREVLRRRVDLFGINEPQLRTIVYQDHYRISVELPGLNQPEAALELIGQTAQLQFREFKTDNPEATTSAIAYIESFQPTDLTGQLLERAQVQFDPNTNKPQIGLQFNAEGAKIFGQLTEKNVGQPLGIFLDNQPLTLPMVNEPIYAGQAVITGQYSLEEAQTLAAQLNAGALPVSISILEQNTIEPSLGQESLNQSIRAGLIGLGLVAIFMILLYGFQGLVAVIGLIGYGLITVALYKMIPVTVTLPGIAGLLLSIGMAVDSNILSFERIKQERRAGKNKQTALKQGYGRSWNTIKDANMATLSICFILFNPLGWGFLNSSGPIRGFALTLALGLAVSIFTGVFYSRWMLELFWNVSEPKTAQSKEKTV